MDALKGFGELGLGSRLKRLSDLVMRETQLVYDFFNIDFDPYLFPIYKIIINKDGVTNSEIQSALNFTQPAITQAINKLTKKGLIKIQKDKIDSRKKIIFPSKKGLATLEKLEPLWESIAATAKEYTQHKSVSFIEQLNELENKLQLKPFSQSIINKVTQNINPIEIVSFKKEYKARFYDLNVEWLKTFFNVEAYDEEILSEPEKYIIDKGGHIFFAKIDGEIVGTVALMPYNNTVELTKMAVSPEHRGKKIGQYLLQHCINYARDVLKLPKLMLYSNRKLENAIYIYRKYGFIEIPKEPNSPYKRSDIKMELKL